MSKRLEPKGIRPSEDIIRRRLVERRLAHELAQERSGWFSRARAGHTGGYRMPGGRLGRRPSFATRLRERPIAAFFAATIIGIAMIGALGAFLRLDAHPGDERGVSPQIASNDETSTVAGQHGSKDAPAPDKAGSDEINVGSTTRAAQAVVGAGRPPLRETVGALPPSIAAASPADGMSVAAKGPDISSRAVAAALALRLPHEPTERRGSADPAPAQPAGAASAPAPRPDRLTTTGSITRAVAPQEPVAPDELAGELKQQAATLDPTVASPAATAPGTGEPAKARASVTANVNLRARPENDATILAVLPKGRAVTVEKCDQWCAVSADGKSGYVFKSFVDQAG